MSDSTPQTRPCDICCRVHPGPRCRSETAHTIAVTMHDHYLHRIETAIRAGHAESRSELIRHALDEYLAGVT